MKSNFHCADELRHSNRIFMQLGEHLFQTHTQNSMKNVQMHSIPSIIWPSMLLVKPSMYVFKYLMFEQKILFAWNTGISVFSTHRRSHALFFVTISSMLGKYFLIFLTSDSSQRVNLLASTNNFSSFVNTDNCFRKSGCVKWFCDTLNVCRGGWNAKTGVEVDVSEPIDPMPVASTLNEFNSGNFDANSNTFKSCSCRFSDSCNWCRCCVGSKALPMRSNWFFWRSIFCTFVAPWKIESESCFNLFPLIRISFNFGKSKVPSSIVSMSLHATSMLSRFGAALNISCFKMVNLLWYKVKCLSLVSPRKAPLSASIVIWLNCMLMASRLGVFWKASMSIDVIRLSLKFRCFSFVGIVQVGKRSNPMASDKYCRLPNMSMICAGISVKLAVEWSFNWIIDDTFGMLRNDTEAEAISIGNSLTQHAVDTDSKAVELQSHSILITGSHNIEENNNDQTHTKIITAITFHMISTILKRSVTVFRCFFFVPKNLLKNTHTKL